MYFLDTVDRTEHRYFLDTSTLAGRSGFEWRYRLTAAIIAQDLRAIPRQLFARQAMGSALRGGELPQALAGGCRFGWRSAGAAN